MIRNYLKIAFRTIWKNKVFSFINILGLSIGLSAAFVIGAMVFYDLSFDKFHPDGDRIYRVSTSFTSPEGEFYNAGVTVPLAQALKDFQMEELETVAPFFMTYPIHVENEETGIRFKNPEYVIYTGPAYFKTFNYEWLLGDKRSALKEPNKIVLSEARAKKYFPNHTLAEIIGKSVVYNDTISTEVSGIVANFKERTDIVFEEFISLKTADTQDMTNVVNEFGWDNTNSASQLFIKLSKNAIPSEVQNMLTKIALEHDEAEMVAIGRSNTYRMQPLSDIHLNPDYGTFDFDESRTTMATLKSLLLLAAILVLLGCINFINLNTAQAIQRAKEIGIRKTLGSSRKQLIFQFLGETFLLTLAATLFSVLFAKWLMYLFSDFIPTDLTFDIFWSPLVIVGVVLMLLIVTLFSGFYPALILSKYKPISVFKNQIVPNSDKGALRKYLTIFQFVIAQVFIIATLLVGKQLNYVMKKDMGFKTEAIAYFRTPWSTPSIEKKQRLVTEIEALSLVSKVNLGGQPPASFSTHSMGVLFQDSDKEINSDLQLIYGDATYFNLYGLQLLAGRLPLNDTIQEYVINETYLKQLGFDNPESIIGKTFKAVNENQPIVGVMKDFNQRSLKTKIEPMVFTGDTFRSQHSQFNTVSFELSIENSTQWPETITQIETIWKNMYPDSEFKYNFMDDTVKQFYEKERKTAILLQWATGLAILISCLGLLGLVIHTTERRTKEIGVRKILGASIFQLNLLLSKDFLKLVLIAFLIATPIAWYGLTYWLEGFANKTILSWWIFILSGFAMIVIALLIMSIKIIASVNTNPVKSLRKE